LKLAEVAVIIVVGSGFVRKRIQDALAAAAAALSVCRSRILINLISTHQSHESLEVKVFKK
jgi:hypothetical protein